MRACWRATPTRWRIREEAVAILRQAGPGAAADLAEAVGLLSNDYRAFDRLDEAEAAAREAVALNRRLSGDDHPSTAIARVHLAQLIHDRKRYDEAIATYREVLPVLERALGAKHFITVNSWNNYAITLGVAGNHAAAGSVQRRVVELRLQRAAGGPSDEVANALQNLAVTLLRLGRHDDALRLSGEAHATYQAVLPPGHPWLAYPLLTRAEIQLDAGDHAGAERSAREAEAILRDGLPAGHFATAVARCRIGAALARQARAAEARPLIEAALADLRASQQAPERHLTECAAHLAALAAQPK
jgi:tetratricopeptide (TPR) repeat protein